MDDEIELLAPAGSWDCARAAIENGADAIYFGLDVGFNARARAANISLDNLPRLMAMLHACGVRGYLTLNTLVFSDELPRWELTVAAAARAGVDAVLVQDVGAAVLIRAICPTLDIHGSTQMTITSAECLAVVESLGLKRVVLARELSLGEIGAIHQATDVPLEAFAHGALCVAYSGQCLTSESLGGRSANRGQCAQACRLPYDLICDGEHVDLGDIKYLLSPQDLAAHALLPDMLAAGVRCFKIEGRLKTPEYVANTTGKYRKALDAACEQWRASSSAVTSPGAAAVPVAGALSPQEVDEMELSFSRGFSPGWLQGCDHKMLAPGLSSAKRGLFVGEVHATGKDWVQIRGPSPEQKSSTLPTAVSTVKPGDGVAISRADASSDDMRGGRVYEVIQRESGMLELHFGRGKMSPEWMQPGMLVWKTSDPQLERQLRRTFEAKHPVYRLPLALELSAVAGRPLRAVGHVHRGAIRLATAEVKSEQPLERARKHVLTETMIWEQLGRLGGTRFRMNQVNAEIVGEPMAPLSLLNQIRKQLVAKLESAMKEAAWAPARSRTIADAPQLERLRAAVASRAKPADDADGVDGDCMRVLCRSMHQLAAAVEAECREVIADFQDIREFREAVALAHDHGVACWLATPRIQKPGELGVFRAMEKHRPDGMLVRNLAGLAFFRDRLPVAADFSLNAANELTVGWLRDAGAERVTASYDLNRDQLLALLEHCPTEWLEVVIHQHMPMFHMEHCVFCSVLSPGANKHDCGRPCDVHDVRLRDRVGKDHTLHADVGCRNTVYNATPQSAAEIVPLLKAKGVRHFRVEWLDDQPAADLAKMLTLYRDLLAGRVDGKQVWSTLQASNRVGVTRGALEEKRNPLEIL